jgi:hypothetical protein
LTIGEPPDPLPPSRQNPEFATRLIGSHMDHGKVGTYDSFFDGFSTRLAQRGFSVRRRIGWRGYSFDLVASTSKYEISKFGKMTRFIIASAIESANPGIVEAFSARATEFALENRGSLLPRGLGGSLLSIPVAVSQDFSEKVKGWITQTLAKKHWAAFEFPVLLSTKNGEIFYCTRTPMWGWAYYRGFRNFVEEQIRF